MARTAVGLFKSAEVAESVLRDIEAKGFPRTEVRTLDEPLDFGQHGVLSIPRIDFEVQVFRELTRMGATEAQADAYVDGLRRGGVLVFATGSDQQRVDDAAAIMNQHGALEVEETRAEESPELASAAAASFASPRSDVVLAGRIRQTPGNAKYFVW